jgi:hypothetical protein
MLDSIAMQWLFAALLALLQAASHPPPYPRPGTTKLIDNDRVLVWDVTWPKGGTPPMHQHPFDMTGIYYWPGDRIITSLDGTKRTVSTRAGQIQWLLKGVTHVEEGASDDSLRAVMIELKGDGPSGRTVQSVNAPVFTAATPLLLDNARVTVSAYKTLSAPTGSHFHRMDTVVVFTENHMARAIFVKAGETHDDEGAAAEHSVTVFELR